MTAVIGTDMTTAPTGTTEVTTVRIGTTGTITVVTGITEVATAIITGMTAHHKIMTEEDVVVMTTVRTLQQTPLQEEV